MAVHKAYIKDIKKNIAARARNKAKRARIRNIDRQVRQASGEDALKLAKLLSSVADNAARQGVIHKNLAARLKSRAWKKVAVAAK